MSETVTTWVVMHNDKPVAARGYKREASTLKQILRGVDFLEQSDDFENYAHYTSRNHWTIIGVPYR